MPSTTKKSGAAYILALLVTIPLFFRGLFFEQDYFVFAAIFSIGLGVACLRGYALKLDCLTDIALGGLALSYLLSVFTGVYTYTAVLEASRYILLFLLYLAAKSAFRHAKTVEKAYTAILYVLALTALTTLFSASGMFTFPGAYSAAEHERWLSGTVQYHNAFGILMVAGFFMAAGLNKHTLKSSAFILNGLCSFLFMFGILMSYSRGAWIVVPVLLVLFLILATFMAKVRLFATGIASLGAVLCSMPAFSACLIAKNTIGALGMLALGMLLFVLFYYGLHLVFDKWSRTKHFKAVALSLLAVLLILAVLIVCVPSLTQLLPAQLATRISGIRFGSETVQERFVFYKDAFALYKDQSFSHLLFGNGGNAWAYLYGMYQSYDYAASQAHSYMMQILVEAGALGFLFWIFTIILFFIQAFRAKKSKLGSNLCAAVACAGAALILHSFIDFTLSYPAILCLLWLCIGTLSAFKSERAKSISVNKWFVTALCAILALFSVLGGVASFCAKDGEAEKAAQNYAVAYNSYSTASTLIPFHTEYAANALFCKGATGEEITAEQVEALTKAAPQNKAVQETAFYCYDVLGDYPAAYKCVKQIVTLQPKNDTHYVSLATVWGSAIRQTTEKLSNPATDTETYNRALDDTVYLIRDFLSRKARMQSIQVSETITEADTLLLESKMQHATLLLSLLGLEER